MQRRTIIVGDIHGCYLEFLDILNRIGFEKGKDQLYLTGDVINRGPQSKEVFLLIQELEAISILGNHELYLLREAEDSIEPYTWVADLKKEFGSLYSDFLESIRTWPLFIETEDFILVHGGLIPAVPLAESDPFILTNIRTWDGLGKDLKSKQNPPWFDFYQGEKLVVFGHWAALEGVVRPHVIGLDTGCVYGKKLSALLLPERKVISVPAREVHCPI